MLFHDCVSTQQLISWKASMEMNIVSSSDSMNINLHKHVYIGKEKLLCNKGIVMPVCMASYMMASDRHANHAF